MTKNEWISYIQNHLRKIDETNKYHDTVVEKTIDTVYSQLFSEAYARDKKGAWKYVRDYTETLSTTVDFTSGYSLSNTPVMLPRLNGGLFNVKFTVVYSTTFTGASSYDEGTLLTGIDLTPVTDILGDIAGDSLVITNSTHYNGTTAIGEAAGSSTYITSPYVATDTGTVTYTQSSPLQIALTDRGVFNYDVDSDFDTVAVKGFKLGSLSGDKLYMNFSGYNNGILAYSILPSFSTLSGTDEVVLPLGAEEVMADRVLDTMRLIPPADLMIDNSDTYGGEK